MLTAQDTANIYGAFAGLLLANLPADKDTDSRRMVVARAVAIGGLAAVMVATLPLLPAVIYLTFTFIMRRYNASR